MPPRARGLLGHAAVYGLGQGVSALGSLCLLPLYTRCLPPGDYGVVAIIEMSLVVAAALAGSGLGTASTRLHYRTQRDAAARHRVWTTGLLAIGAQTALLLLVASLLRRPLGALVFGRAAVSGRLFALLLLLAGSSLIVNYATAYLRAQERSGTFLALTAGTVVLRVGVVAWLLLGLGLGLEGYLLAAVLTHLAQAAVLLALLFLRRPLRFEPALWREMAGFGSAIAAAGLAVLAMHQADLWLLRSLLGDLAQIGIYALAYALVGRCNALLLTPFTATWSARLYLVDRHPARAERYRAIFRGFALVCGSVLLALAVAAEPLVRLLAAPAYRAAAALVPILCLGFFFFSLHGLVSVPALLHGRSRAISLTAAIAAAGNIALGLLLIPWLGVRGAAISSVLTYALYTLGGHLRYRRVEDLGYPLGYLLQLVLGGVAAFLLWRALPLHPGNAWWELLAALAYAGAAAGAAALLLARDLLPRPLLRPRAWWAVVRGETAG